MTVIAVINCVCACVSLSAEDDNFPRGAGGGGGGVPNNYLIWVFRFGLSENILFQASLDLLGISIISCLHTERKAVYF